MPLVIAAHTSAFDDIAASYDSTESGNRIFQWMRRRVHAASEEAFANANRLLDIGCGTGTDALFFAQRGHELVAMDPSRAMLAVAREKLSIARCDRRVTFREMGAERIDILLDEYGEASFDGIYSNFGALNCIADLRLFAETAAALLRPGGRILLNIMPPVCPWEWVYFLSRLKPRSALRRLRGNPGTSGLPVQLGDRRVQTFYHAPHVVRESFRPACSLVRQFALGLCIPPIFMNIADRSAHAFSLLMRCEQLVAGWPLLRNWGDHTVLVLAKH